MDGACFATTETQNEVKYDGDNAPFHHLARKNGRTYTVNTLRQIQIMYIIAAILWVALIIYCQWYRTGLLGWAFLLIPLIIFAINYQSTCGHTTEIEGEMFQGNFLSFGFLITIILINWTKVGNRQKLFKILGIALILIMFSLIDIWVKKEHLILIKHFRTILQTAALSLLAYALYTYYVEAVSIDFGQDSKSQ